MKKIIIFFYSLLILFFDDGSITEAFKFNRFAISKPKNYSIQYLKEKDTEVKIDENNSFLEKKLIERIEAEVYAETGAKLEDLINPSKVVNLERDIENLSKKLLNCNDEIEIQKITSSITKKRDVLKIEKRAVMRNWLKSLFIFQSVIAGAISLIIVHELILSILYIYIYIYITKNINLGL